MSVWGGWSSWGSLGSWSAEAAAGVTWGDTVTAYLVGIGAFRSLGDWM